MVFHCEYIDLSIVHSKPKRHIQSRYIDQIVENIRRYGPRQRNCITLRLKISSKNTSKEPFNTIIRLSDFILKAVKIRPDHVINGPVSTILIILEKLKRSMTFHHLALALRTLPVIRMVTLYWCRMLIIASKLR
jgi:hypothetical protein